MIEIQINKRTPDGVVEELAYIKVVNVSDPVDAVDADYLAQIAVERYAAVGVHNRVIRSFPRTKYNVLALLKQVLESLSPKELELEPGVSPSDLARRQSGTRKALSSEATNPISHHGPSVWGGQPE